MCFNFYKPKKGIVRGFASQDGFSMVEMMVGVALIGISAIGIVQGLDFARTSQKDAALKASSGKFQDSFRAAIADRARDFISDSCTGARYGYSDAGSGGTTGGTTGATTGATLTTASPVSKAFDSLSMTADPSLGGGMAFTTKPTDVADVFTSAAVRCRDPKPSSNQASGMGKIDLNLVTKGDYAHFCLNLLVNKDNKKAGSTENFWTMDGAFAEILIIPVDLATDSPIFCKDAKSSSQGFKVVYSIFGSYKDKSSGALKGIRSNGLFFGAIKSAIKPTDTGSTTGSTTGTTTGGSCPVGQTTCACQSGPGPNGVCCWNGSACVAY